MNGSWGADECEVWGVRSEVWGGPYWGVMRWQMWRVSRAIIIFTSPRLQQTHTGHHHSIMSLWSWYWYCIIWYFYLYTSILRLEKRNGKFIRRIKSMMFPALTIFPSESVDRKRRNLCDSGPGSNHSGPSSLHHRGHLIAGYLTARHLTEVTRTPDSTWPVDW